jgi:hypothetical protein
MDAKDPRSRTEKLRDLANNRAATKGERQNAEAALNKITRDNRRRRFEARQATWRRFACKSRPSFTGSTIFDSPCAVNPTPAESIFTPPRSTSPEIELFRAIAKIDSPIVKVGLVVLVVAAVLDRIRRDP